LERHVRGATQEEENRQVKGPAFRAPWPKLVVLAPSQTLFSLMTSEVSPELWLRCDFAISKACSAWLGQEVRQLEVEGGDEDAVEVDVEAKEIRVQVDRLSWNREREPPPHFGRRRRARKRRHQCLAEPGESKKGRHCVQ